MEKVTAYKAFNGKLFESEEKCLAYEKKYEGFPKEREEITYAIDEYGNEIKEIEKHDVIIREKPNTKEKHNIFYVIDGRYKIYDEFIVLDTILLKNPLKAREPRKCVQPKRQITEYDFIENISRLIVREFMKIKNMQTAINNVINEYYRHFDECPIGPRFRFDIEHPKQEEWIIEDKRWYQGTNYPNRLYIEDIKKC